MRFLAMMLCAAFLTCAVQGAGDAARPTPTPAIQAMRAAAVRRHDAAKAGCLNALSPDHKAQVMAIIMDFNARKITYEAAGSAVAALLSDREVAAIGEQRQIMVDDMHAQARQARGEQPDPNLANLPPLPIGRPEAGSFLVSVVGDIGVVYSQLPPLPLPSASPN